MSTTEKPLKPLGRKAYGSIGHLPTSRLGPMDKSITIGQAIIATEKARDHHDRIIVQEKVDGSCVSVALVNGEIHALGRAGYPARTSPHEQHILFADWVDQHEDRFRAALHEGERIVGEWIAQAHGTIYHEVGVHVEPFIAFDIMRETQRMTFQWFQERAWRGGFRTPTLLNWGSPVSIASAMRHHQSYGLSCDEPEGIVYRVERHGTVDFLCKWVRPDKIDGKYLPEVSGKPAVWNWRP